MKRAQCQICSEYKLTLSYISRCPNAECSAFNCKECLETWYQEKRECPICHTKIGDIEENLEAIEDGQETQNDQGTTFTCVCSGCSVRCHRIEIQTCWGSTTKDILSVFVIAIQLICLFLFAGLLSFNFCVFTGYGSLTDGYEKTKHNYTHPTFYLMLISLGMVTCGTILVCIGILAGCCHGCIHGHD